MRILTVIPIKRAIAIQTLTYFTNKDVEIGSIVSIPVRKKNVYGLVIESKMATEIKSELKSLSYSIRKIGNIETRSFLSQAFIDSSRKIADYCVGSPGSVLSALIPKAILEESDKLEFIPKEKPKGIFHETLLLQSNIEERYATYRSLIREEFAKSRSVFFCLPTTEDLLNASSILEKGIENYTFILHSGLSKKEIISLWKKVVESDHPVLVIATGSFLSIPRNDFGTIILEKESSRTYKMQLRPFIDIRDVARIVSKELNIRLVLGDTLLRVETLWEEKNHNQETIYSELAPLKFRSLSSATCELLDARFPQDMKKKEFSVFGEKLRTLISRTKEKNEHTFIFCGRKGLYPLTVCSDCGTTVTCKNCNSPVVLYGRPGDLYKPSQLKNSLSKGNLFVCNHCGERRDANELCVFCKGWRLNAMGIGVEKVAEEIKSIMGGVSPIIIDRDHISTHREAVKARNLFYSTPGSVMVGTEMALLYLNKKIENAAVVSIDSLFSIPDFQINEKVFHILIELRSIGEKYFAIQTRQDPKSSRMKIFDYALHGNLIDFYRDEIEDRKNIGYPPFTTYIKITLEGEKNLIKKMMNDTVEFMKPFELVVFDGWNPGNNKQYTVNGLISLPRGKWIDRELLDKLRELPPNYTIKIDPTTLL